MLETGACWGRNVSGMGRTYSDQSTLREVYSTMFDAIADDDSMDELVAMGMVINFRLTDPAADIWVDGRRRPVATTFEPIGVDASLTARLSADSSASGCMMAARRLEQAI